MWLACSLQPAGAQVFETHGDWILACDNLLSCTALGARQGDGIYSVFLRIARDAGPHARPVMDIGGLLDENAPGDHPIHLAFEGRAPGLPREMTVRQYGSSSGTATIPDELHQPILDGLRDADSLTVTIVGEDGLSQSLGIGLAEARTALAAMDRGQGRTGTVTALAAPGDAAAATVPPAPPAPVIAAAAAPKDAPAVTFPAALRDHLCDDVPDIDPDDPNALTPLVDFAARLAPDLTLWGLRCWQGAYNSGSILLVGRDGGTIEPLTLEVPPALEGQVADLEVVNGFFSPEDMTLASYSKGRGMGDCGSWAKWVWDGERFRLLRLEAMQECRGVYTDDWPSLWRAVVR